LPFSSFLPRLTAAEGLFLFAVKKKQKTPAENFSFKVGNEAWSVQSEKFIRPDLGRTRMQCYGQARWLINAELESLRKDRHFDPMVIGWSEAEYLPVQSGWKIEDLFSSSNVPSSTSLSLFEMTILFLEATRPLFIGNNSHFNIGAIFASVAGSNNGVNFTAFDFYLFKAIDYLNISVFAQVEVNFGSYRHVFEVG